METNNLTISLCDNVGDDETLYRVIKRSRPDCVTKNNGISPALFKDPNGVSVDRDGGRSEDDIIRYIVDSTFEKRAKAIVSLVSAVCFEIGVDIIPAPSVLNPFHANIFLNDNEQIGNLQALQLADRCKIVYYNSAMEWTIA